MPGKVLDPCKRWIFDHYKIMHDIKWRVGGYKFTPKVLFSQLKLSVSALEPTSMMRAYFVVLALQLAFQSSSTICSKHYVNIIGRRCQSVL